MKIKFCKLIDRVCLFFRFFLAEPRGVQSGTEFLNEHFARLSTMLEDSQKSDLSDSKLTKKKRGRKKTTKSVEHSGKTAG